LARAKYIVKPRKSKVAGPFPLDCPDGGRRKGNRRVLSGCRVSSEASHPLAEYFHHALRIVLILERNQQIVRIPDQRCFAEQARL